MKTLAKIWKYIRPKTHQEMINDYLASSANLVELERRQQAIINGKVNIW